MKIAFLVAAHAHPELLNTLIEQLLRYEGCDVYLHIDAKSTGLPGKVRAHPRLFVLTERYSVFWGDISQIDAAMAMMKAAWNAGRDYDYYCYGSGQDLHVRPGLPERLAQDVGRSYMTWKKDRPAERNGFTAIRWPDALKQNFKGLHPLRMIRSLLLRLSFMKIVLRRSAQRLPRGHDIYMGSAWFTLHREAVRYLVTSGHVAEARRFFQESLMPEERFFQTVLLNSPLAPTLVNENFLYVVFAGNSPKDFTMADVAAIDASGKFIARKFNPRVDDKVIAHYARATEQVAGDA